MTLISNDTLLPQQIGQMAHDAESVFSWFKPSYSALGSQANTMGLVTPEAEILITPAVISYANSMSSLARSGTGRVEAKALLTFEPSGQPTAQIYSLPKGLDLTIEDGYVEGAPVKLTEGVKLVIQNGEGDKCTQNYHEGEPWTIVCRIEQTLTDTTGSYGAPVSLTGSGGTVTAKNIVRWAWNGNLLIFFADGTLDEVNAALRPGDEVLLVYTSTEEKCIQQYDSENTPYRARCTLKPTADFGSLPQGKMTFNVTGIGGTFSARIIRKCYSGRGTSILLQTNLSKHLFFVETAEIDWAWKGTHLYFEQEGSIDQVNAALPPGSPISLSVMGTDPIDELELLLVNGRLSDSTRAGESRAAFSF